MPSDPTPRTLDREKSLVRRIVRAHARGTGIRLTAAELDRLMSGWIGTGLHEILEDSHAER